MTDDSLWYEVQQAAGLAPPLKCHKFGTHRWQDSDPHMRVCECGRHERQGADGKWTVYTLADLFDDDYAGDQ